MPTDPAPAAARFDDLPVEQQIERLHGVIETLSRWLVEAQTGYGVHDHRALMNLLNTGRVTDV